MGHIGLVTTTRPSECFRPSALFDIPRDICYLNAASYSPLPIRTLEAGRAAVGRKGRPWTLEASFANQQHERARTAAARLIHAEPSDIALIPSISYGVATAAKYCRSLAARASSFWKTITPPLCWNGMRGPRHRALRRDVRQPDDGDWTSAVLESIERTGAPLVSLASISSVHWSDGGLIDVDKVGAALRQRGAAFLIDATQSAGVLALDVRRLDPDFVIFPTYKWLVGPYGRAFLYVAKRHQNGIPLEQTAAGRRNVRAENAVYFSRPRLRSRCAALRHGRTRSFHLDGDGLHRHGDDGRMGRSGDFAAPRDADGAHRSERARYRRSGAGASSAGAAYIEPRLQGRNAGGPCRGASKRRRLRRPRLGACASRRMCIMTRPMLTGLSRC
jgi:hypothetical protein